MHESVSAIGASQCILSSLYTQRTQPNRCRPTSCAAMYAQDGLCQIWLVCRCNHAGVLADMQVLPLKHAPRACLASAASLGSITAM